MHTDLDYEKLDDQELASIAGKCLQELQERHSRKELEHKVQFPRKQIRTAYEIRQDWKFIPDDVLRSNISYTVMLSDVLFWLLRATDIFGIAKQMLVLNQVFLLAAIVESATKSVLKGKASRNTNYNKRLEFLRDDYGLAEDDFANLKELWKYRQRFHLFLNKEREWDKSLEELVAKLDSWVGSYKNLKKCLEKI